MTETNAVVDRLVFVQGLQGAVSRLPGITLRAGLLLSCTLLIGVTGPEVVSSSFVGLPAAQAQADGLPIRDLTLDGNGQLVVVFGTGGAFPPSPSISEMAPPNKRLVIDFHDAGFDGAVPSGDVLTGRFVGAIPSVKAFRCSAVKGVKGSIARLILELDDASDLKARVAKVEEGAVTISFTGGRSGSQTATTASSSGVAGGAATAGSSQSSADAYDAYYNQFRQQKEADNTISNEWTARKGNLSEVGGKMAIKPITNVSNWMGSFWKKDKPDAAAPSEPLVEKTAVEKPAKEKFGSAGLPQISNQAAEAVAKDAETSSKTGGVSGMTEAAAGKAKAAAAMLTKGMKIWKRKGGEQPAAQSQTQEQTQEASQKSFTQPVASLSNANSSNLNSGTPSITAQASGGQAKAPEETTLAEEPSSAKASESDTGSGGWGEWGAQSGSAKSPDTASGGGAVTSLASAAPASNAAASSSSSSSESQPASTGSEEATPTQHTLKNKSSEPVEKAPEKEAPAEAVEPAEAVPSSGDSPRIQARKLYNKAQLQHLSGNLDGAIAGYKAAVAADSELGPAYCNLGLAYNQMHNYHEALEAFRKALACNASDAIAYNGIGAALKAQKDIAGAAKNWQTAVKLNPKLGVAHYNLGTAYEQQGEFDKALASYQASVKCDSRMGEAHYRIGLILQKQKRLSEARHHFELALKLSGKSEYSDDARQRLALLEKAAK
ncbi:MAG: tetratricopeptide repeat protein [Candidatus Obscuribacterales bacterium]|nr:tetratricopeptide repeat protein [Candidatus Obscuribacterales bacterium]